MDWDDTDGKKKNTAIGHHVEFLDKTMDEMDCFPELKSHYIVINNAHIHTAKEID